MEITTFRNRRMIGGSTGVLGDGDVRILILRQMALVDAENVRVWIVLAIENARALFAISVGTLA
jgi:hypothetical protein